MSETDSPIDITRNFMQDLENNDLAAAASYLHDTFIFSGWTPRPLDKQGFLDLIAGLKEGIPGLIFNLHNLQKQHMDFTGTMQIAGYQSDSFIIPSLGIPPIPQTANSISMPAEDVTFTLNRDQITTMDVQRVPDGGIKGLLHQLGIDVTIVQ
jgi:hypothetical protein